MSCLENTYRKFRKQAVRWELAIHVFILVKDGFSRSVSGLFDWLTKKLWKVDILSSYLGGATPKMQAVILLQNSKISRLCRTERRRECTVSFQSFWSFWQYTFFEKIVLVLPFPVVNRSKQKQSLRNCKRQNRNNVQSLVVYKTFQMKSLEVEQLKPEQSRVQKSSYPREIVCILDGSKNFLSSFLTLALHNVVKKSVLLPTAKNGAT